MIYVFPLVAAVVFLVLRLRDARLLAAPDLMVREPAAWAPTRVRVSTDRPRAVAVLALAETRRLLRHPVLIAGLLGGLLLAGVGVASDDSYTRYVELTGGGGASLYGPPMVFIAANLCASRTRRSGAGEVFDATVASPFDRTLAQCLAALGPALAALALELLMWGWFAATGAALPATPPVWALLALPLAVLGAGTLGVMVARWLPFRGAPVVVLVPLVFVSAWASGTAPYLVTLVDAGDWGANDEYVGLVRGVPWGAHAAYVLGLDVMAAIGALLAHQGRRRLLLALGAVATLGTIAAGVLAT